jgi:hypothetical protein
VRQLFGKTYLHTGCSEGRKIKIQFTKMDESNIPKMDGDTKHEYTKMDRI